ncbi:MAG: hypothetical protein HLUCCA24_01950 [Rhodobacteraceae bacterium HLUCCA24]|nr:MAG: hypothetical protein HLUCCA24_01950 [Rhodobacteraceae bacterium HLUCCA24]
MGQGAGQPRFIAKRGPYSYFKASPKFLRLSVMLDVRPRSLRNVENLLHEWGVYITQISMA